MQIKIYSLKSITVAYNNSLRIVLNLPSRCSASFMFATNYIKSFNERIRSSIFSLLCRLLCRLHQLDNLLFINYLHTDIHFKSCMYSYWRLLLYTWHLYCIFFIKFLIFIFTTYLINFLIYLFIIFFNFTLIFYVDHITALIVLYVLYFSYFVKLYFMYIYGRLLVWNKL